MNKFSRAMATTGRLNASASTDRYHQLGATAFHNDGCAFTATALSSF
jgi:hypothetical protein